MSDEQQPKRGETLFVLPEGWRPCPPMGTPEEAIITAHVVTYPDGATRVHLEKRTPERLDTITFAVDN